MTAACPQTAIRFRRLFLDIQAAYDTVWQVVLLEKLRQKGDSRVHSELGTQGFLTGRCSFLGLGEAEVEIRPLSAGCHRAPRSLLHYSRFL